MLTDKPIIKIDSHNIDSNAVLSISVDGFSNLDMFDLEKDLPDELMGGSWGEQPGVPKPPAQGPGPGGQMGGPQQQLNGDDPTAVAQMHRQLNNHLIQQVSIWD